MKYYEKSQLMALRMMILEANPEQPLLDMLAATFKAYKMELLVQCEESEVREIKALTLD